MAADSVLYVCVTCRQSGEEGDIQPRPGKRLLDKLEALPTPENLDIRGVECLSACKNGCSIALAGQGKWQYVYGLMDPDQHAEDILDGAAKYAQSTKGIVPWRERPQILKKQVLSRIPPLDISPESS